nr:MAG TPA: hypothetical protein [Caudoviricetes sp.]
MERRNSIKNLASIILPKYLLIMQLPFFLLMSAY